jgi:flagellar motor component MotA
MKCFDRPADENDGCLSLISQSGPAMFAIIGIIVVFGAVAGGYLMEHGNLKVLLQPAEFLIIGGAASGTVLVANPLHVLKQIAFGAIAVFKGSPFTGKRYLSSLKIAYQLLNKARRQGLMSLESDVEEPDKSPVFFRRSRVPERRSRAQLLLRQYAHGNQRCGSFRT